MKVTYRSPVILTIISLTLLFFPSNLTSTAKLTTLAIFIPINNIADSFSSFLNRLIPPSSSVDYQRTEELERDNLKLQDEVRRLTNENTALKLRLQSISNFKELSSDIYQSIPADVIIPSDPSNWRKSLVIAKGSKAGIEKGMPVVWGNHLVGKISDVGPFTSQVLLLTDRGYKVAALPVSQYTKDKFEIDRRDIGIAEGTSSDYCELKWMLQESKLKKGWFIVTAGDPIAGIPKGLMIGEIEYAAYERGPYYRTQIKPLINLQNLEFIIVLKKSR